MAKKTERENIEKIQQCLAIIKKRSQDEIDRWTKEGDAQKVNAWYAFNAEIRLAHAKGTKDLIDLFPEYSEVVTDGPVVFGGGGGGR